jgi:putative molybdopterin biosynthesis protein
MAFSYLTNVSLREAVADYIMTLGVNGLRPLTENIPVQEALNRRSAKAVYAQICAPHYHACAMDGIALLASLTYGATGTTPVYLRNDQFIRVDTGDLLPRGCDAVIMIEDVIDVKTSIRLNEAAVPWQHIRQIGEDICAGEMILPSFTDITPSAMGAMLAGGVMNLEVIKEPLVGIIPTGDEIVPPTSNPKEGDIIEFNSTIFTAMLHEWGASARTYPIVKDDLALIKAALAQALEECDIVLLCAGSSAGREDYSAQAIRDVGIILHHGIAIKPGKPAILGYSGTKAILGIPGYPISGIIVLENILKPIIDRLFARDDAARPIIKAALSRAVNSPLKYEEFIRVRLGAVNDSMVATPLSSGGGIVTSFMKADGLLQVPQSSEGYKAGESVPVTLLRPLSAVNQTLVVTGSHDPLIDELADMMRRRWYSASLGSTHVGSMGGIMAIKRQEAHVAGIHLLDENSGEYNTAYLRKHFPNGRVRLIECVMRSQGLMVKKNNPKDIRGIGDLGQKGLLYVNRQKGSGTRILLDYLLNKEGVAKRNIYGYEREEFTHTAIAALIAADSADVGLGIYAAAKTYDLDFIPICEEQYDFLIPDYAWDTQYVKRLLELMTSSEFRTRLEAMGGYQVANPGQVRLKL